MANDSLLKDLLTDLTAAQTFTKANKHTSGAFSSVFNEGQWGKKQDEPRCWGECSHYDRITRWYQCGHPGKTRLADGSTWCGVHDPNGVGRREQKAEERNRVWQDKWAAKKKQYEKEAKEREILPLLLNAMQEIADGHNDPRTMAKEVLAEWQYPIPRKPLPSK